MNLDKLLSAVKRGDSLSGQEADALISQLELGGAGDDLYTLIQILGRARCTAAKEAIEKYLTFGLAANLPTDEDESDMVRRIALEVLCSWWELKDYFQHAVVAATSDPSDFVRMVALTSVGALGRVYPELASSAARCLLHGYSKETAGEEVWESAYIGMLMLLGTPQREYPRLGEALKSGGVRRDILAEVTQLGSHR